MNTTALPRRPAASTPHPAPASSCDLEIKFDKNNLERQLEDKGKKFEELRVETQNLKSDKNYVERQIEDKVKALEHKVNNL